MGNLDLYNQVRKVPEEAQKTITGGRLKGFTEINPMWRIKKLTELFGVCGIGWYTEIVRYWTEEAVDNQRTANILIKLYIKTEKGWSMPIEGIGGTSSVSKEPKGLYINEDCYKMAYTDALSVACKSLGIGADVYFDKDCTKYTHCDQQQMGVSKEKLTEAMLNSSPAFCESINEWLRQISIQNGGIIDVEATLKAHYDIEDATVQRINAEFNNYRMSKL